MTIHLQRFCPFCDRAFQEGEAVLRCEGCGVMHHPGCWVTNNGCATQGEHRMAPLAQAYSTGRVQQTQAAPRADTRPDVAAANGGAARAEPIQFQPRPGVAAPEQEWPVIGGAPAPVRIQRQREGEGFVPPVAPRRYVPPQGEPQPGRKPLPRIYNRHRIIEFWYLPVAVLVAVGIALGVIWAAEKLTGRDGEDEAPAAAASFTPAPTIQTGGSNPTTAGASASPAGGTTPSAASGKFKAGDTAVVTGAGDCLNVRTAPGRTNPQGTPNPAIVCLNDGTEIKVVAGPESAGDLKWWKITTTLGDGWAAEDYLVKK